MSMEKLLLKTTFMIMLFSSCVLAAPALSKTKTFTQPDGTTFEGILKGDSSFHWIESNGNIIKYNPQDKFYYKAVLDANSSLRLTNEKPATQVEHMASPMDGVDRGHDVSPSDRRNLRIIYKNTKVGNYPR